MKFEYKTPTIEISKFHIADIITTSSLDSETVNKTVENADIPQVIDADNLFNYN